MRVSLLLFGMLLCLHGGWIAYVIRSEKPIEFWVYYVTAEIFRRGFNAYDVSENFRSAVAEELEVPALSGPYRYPPLTAFLTASLLPLSPHSAAAVWLAANSLAMIGAAWLIGRTIDTTFGVPLALSSLLFFVPPLATLHAGQVNGLLLLSMALFLWGFQRSRPELTASWLGLGVMIKLIPTVLVPHLFWNRRWRVLTLTLFYLGILTLLAVPLVGWSDLGSYGRRALGLLEADKLIAYPPNQTLYGFFARLLTFHRFGRSLAERPDLALLLSQGASCLLVLLAAFACRPVRNCRNVYAMEFCLLCLTALLIAPFAWYHLHVILLFLFLFLAARFAADRPRHMIYLGIGYAFVNIHGLFWHYLVGHVWLLSMPMYVMLALWGTLVRLLLRLKAKHSQSIDSRLAGPDS